MTKEKEKKKRERKTGGKEKRRRRLKRRGREKTLQGEEKQGKRHTDSSCLPNNTQLFEGERSGGGGDAWEGEEGRRERGEVREEGKGKRQRQTWPQLTVNNNGATQQKLPPTLTSVGRDLRC